MVQPRPNRSNGNAQGRGDLFARQPLDLGQDEDDAFRMAQLGQGRTHRMELVASDEITLGIDARVPDLDGELPRRAGPTRQRPPTALHEASSYSQKPRQTAQPTIERVSRLRRGQE